MSMQKIFTDELLHQMELLDISQRALSIKVGKDPSYINPILTKGRRVKYADARIIFSELDLIKEEYMDDYLNLIGVKMPLNVLNEGFTYDSLANLPDCYKEKNNCYRASLVKNKTETEKTGKTIEKEKKFVSIINKTKTEKIVIAKGKELLITIPENIMVKLSDLSQQEYRTPDQQITKIVADFFKNLEGE